MPLERLRRALERWKLRHWLCLALTLAAWLWVEVGIESNGGPMRYGLAAELAPEVTVDLRRWSPIPAFPGFTPHGSYYVSPEVARIPCPLEAIDPEARDSILVSRRQDPPRCDRCVFVIRTAEVAVMGRRILPSWAPHLAWSDDMSPVCTYLEHDSDYLIVTAAGHFMRLDGATLARTDSYPWLERMVRRALDQPLLGLGALLALLGLPLLALWLGSRPRALRWLVLVQASLLPAVSLYASRL